MIDSDVPRVLLKPRKQEAGLLFSLLHSACSSPDADERRKGKEAREEKGEGGQVGGDAFYPFERRDDAVTRTALLARDAPVGCCIDTI